MYLVEDIDFVFDHPIARREKQGIDYATNEVFKDANFLTIENKRNKYENLELIEKLAYEMGFKHIKRTPSKLHDASWWNYCIYQSASPCFSCSTC